MKIEIQIEELRCPVTVQIFSDPYTTNCGHTIEYEIVDDMKRNFQSCPCCRALITSIVPNLALKNIVSLAIRQHPEIAEEQFISQKLRSKLINLIMQGKTTDVLSVLKESPVLVNSSLNNDEQTVLHLFARRGDVVAVKAVCDLGADINRVDDSNETALKYAVVSQHAEVVQFLLDRNVDLTLKTSTEGAEQGFTALHFAAKLGHAEICAMLIKAGASVTARSARGKTPKEIFQEKNHRLQGIALITALFEQGLADVDQFHALFFAAYKPGIFGGSMKKFKDQYETFEFFTEALEQARKKANSATAQALEAITILVWRS